MHALEEGCGNPASFNWEHLLVSRILSPMIYSYAYDTLSGVTMCLKEYRIWRIVGRIAMLIFAIASCYIYSPLLAAREVIDLSISDSNGVYHLALAMIVDAPFADVHYVITDYVHTYRIDPSIVESEILGKPDASVIRVKTLVNDCVLFFCRNILRVEDVREVGADDIYTVIVPQLSNVRSGTSHWQILPMGARTQINYDMTLDPGFFVPPLIGSYIVEKKLKEETLICLNNIEHIARIRDERLRTRNPMRNTTSSINKASVHGKAN